MIPFAFTLNSHLYLLFPWNVKLKQDFKHKRDLVTRGELTFETYSEERKARLHKFGGIAPKESKSGFSLLG